VVVGVGDVDESVRRDGDAHRRLEVDSLLALSEAVVFRELGVVAHDAPVAEIGYPDRAIRSDRDPAAAVEAARGRLPVALEGEGGQAGFRGVRGVEGVAGDGRAVGVGEAPLGLAVAPPPAESPSVGVEDMDARGTEVGDPEAALAVEGGATRLAEPGVGRL